MSERNEDMMMAELRQAIEKTAGFSIHSSNDYERLSHIIFDQQHATVSASTLKRLWGYAGQDTRPRMFTLDVLARFAGYRDYAAFEKSIGNEAEQQSQLFLADTITADMLAVGDRLLLTWHPDRRCVIEHQGSGQFRVAEAENTKLAVGDTFECHFFINCEPLYIDRLVHDGLPLMNYVAGRVDGVVTKKL